MFRFLLWIGLGYLFFRLFRGQSSVDGERVAGSKGRSQVSGQGEKMVKCAVCGLYVPEKEALAGGWRKPGRYYCSPECHKKQ